MLSLFYKGRDPKPRFDGGLPSHRVLKGDHPPGRPPSLLTSPTPTPLFDPHPPAKGRRLGPLNSESESPPSDGRHTSPRGL